MGMVRFCDEWLLLPQRLAYHEPTASVVVADLHLGYTAVRQHLGDAIPARSIHEELQPLLKVASGFPVRRLVVAGDLFERGFDEMRFRDLQAILDQTGILELAVVPGNHDRGIERYAEKVSLFPQGYDLAGWHICHGDQPIAAARAIFGHWHPATRQRGRKLPCFLTRETQLVLPAFSLDAAGVDLRKDPRWAGWTWHEIRDGDVHTNANARSRSRGR